MRKTLISPEKYLEDALEEWKALTELRHEINPERMRVLERTMAKVKRRGDCWSFEGTITPKGYGRVYVEKISWQPARYRLSSAHRFVYECLIGSIPTGMTLDHLCHNIDLECPGGNICLHRRCVNPAHLEAVSMGENISRSSKTPASINTAKTQCSKGHSLIADNLYIDPSGSRSCKECRRNNVRRWRARSKSVA